MYIMNTIPQSPQSTRVYVVGNETEGYSVTFNNCTRLECAAFRVAHHGWIIAHLDYMQREGELGDYTLFDTSDKATD